MRMWIPDRDSLFAKRLKSEQLGSFGSWREMLKRCYQKSFNGYGAYGGRGIKVCERWWKWESFWQDMGERPAGMSIHRKDGDGDYEPGNCKWATAREQAGNTSRIRLITWDARTMSLAAWARDLAIPAKLLEKRLKRWGMSRKTFRMREWDWEIEDFYSGEEVPTRCHYV